MNQKGFANIILIVLVVILVGVVGYLTLGKKLTNQQTSSEQTQNIVSTEPSPTANNQTPPPQTSNSNKGTIISLTVNPCRQGQYSCVYSYGAKAVLIAKNLNSATMKSSGVSGSGAVSFDEVIGNMKKVSESVSGDRWEGSVRTGLQGTDDFYIEAKDLQGNALKSAKLRLQYESASNITITSPQRNEELQRGTSKEIKWSISNPPKNSWIRIDIAKVPESGQSLSLQEAQVLVKTVPSDSSFVWNIPSNLEARRYEMRVDLYGDESDFNTFVVRSITDFVVK
jgi:hypothetical protein